MNLQEIAFMVSLIQANYHRRMLYFWLNIFFIVVASVVIYYNCTIDHNDHISAFASLLNIFFGAMVIMVSLFRFLIIYIFKSGSFNDEPSFPWAIKKAQMTALREQSAAKWQGFEGLRFSPILHEYFEMY